MMNMQGGTNQPPKGETMMNAIAQMPARSAALEVLANLSNDEVRCEASDFAVNTLRESFGSKLGELMAGESWRLAQCSSLRDYLVGGAACARESKLTNPVRFAVGVALVEGPSTRAHGREDGYRSQGERRRDR